MRTNADEGILMPTELKEYGLAEDTHMILDHFIGSYFVKAKRNGRN